MDYTAEGLLQQLCHTEVAYINGTEYSLWELTDMLDIEDLREATQVDLLGATAVRQLYLDIIEELR